MLFIFNFSNMGCLHQSESGCDRSTGLCDMFWLVRACRDFNAHLDFTRLSIHDRFVHEHRNMQAELSDVFRSDSRFTRLASTISKRKVTEIDLHGSLPNAVALKEARDAIRERCPSVSSGALVSWHVRLSDTGERVNVSDGRLDAWSESIIDE